MLRNYRLIAADFNVPVDVSQRRMYPKLFALGANDSFLDIL